MGGEFQDPNDFMGLNVSLRNLRARRSVLLYDMSRARATMTGSPSLRSLLVPVSRNLLVPYVVGTTYPRTTVLSSISCRSMSRAAGEG
jgi:hypothetical protein